MMDYAKEYDRMVEQSNRQQIEIESLSQQLSAIEAERDKARNLVMKLDLRCPTYEELNKMYDEMMDHHQKQHEQLATVTAERDELVKVLRKIANGSFIQSMELEEVILRMREISNTALAKLGADKTGEV